jgi:membrane protein implicated in regulation of membrane protease activity
MNVQRYPRIFTTWLIGIVLAVVEGYFDTPRVLTVTLVLSLVFAVVIYRWMLRNGRMAIFMDIADSLEGREVCTVAEYEEEVEPEPDEEEELQ